MGGRRWRGSIPSGTFQLLTAMLVEIITRSKENISATKYLWLCMGSLVPGLQSNRSVVINTIAIFVCLCSSTNLNDIFSVIFSVLVQYFSNIP